MQGTSMAHRRLRIFRWALPSMEPSVTPRGNVKSRSGWLWCSSIGARVNDRNLQGAEGFAGRPLPIVIWRLQVDPPNGASLGVGLRKFVPSTMPRTP